MACCCHLMATAFCMCTLPSHLLSSKLLLNDFLNLKHNSYFSRYLFHHWAIIHPTKQVMVFSKSTIDDFTCEANLSCIALQILHWSCSSLNTRQLIVHTPQDINFDRPKIRGNSLPKCLRFQQTSTIMSHFVAHFKSPNTGLATIMWWYS